MCFSVQVDKDLKKLAKRFNATPSPQAFQAFSELQKIEAKKGSQHLKEELGLKRKPSSKVFKDADQEGRIYPGYWANVIVYEGQKRVIKPMRYRVRPSRSLEEIPSKYNVFNCRLDAIEKRRTWQNIFMKNHALFPFLKFYEWVEENGKKVLINFSPENKELMWAPAIYDTWTSPSGEIKFESFALITTDPPPEVEQAGHDRCPIYLKEDQIDSWLQPQSMKSNEALNILKNTEPAHFISHKTN
jgi:putative SOS response-associated peptidase YedK